MTPKQTAYVEHRIAGHRPTQAARMAGYVSHPKTQAGRLEKNPAIAKAIAELTPPAPAQPARSAAYESAEAYLVAIVRGDEVPDALRVSAAKTLIAYESPRQRRPLPPARTPRQSARAASEAEEAELQAAWERKTAAIYERYKK